MLCVYIYVSFLVYGYETMMTRLKAVYIALFKRVFVDDRFYSTTKNRVRPLTSGSPVRPHKDIINANQSRCGAERIASIKCNFKRVSILNFG